MSLTIALVISALVFFLRPVGGLIAYIMAFSWYPTYLSVPLGTIDFTVRRIVILALLCKIVFFTDLLKKFRFIWLDKIVVLYFACQFITGAFTAPSLLGLAENRAGAVFDMALPYFATRMIIGHRRQCLTILYGVLILAGPLAIIGLYQSVTGHNPVGFLLQYSAWKGILDPMGSPLPLRYGLDRAEVLFSHPIMFGLYFSMFGPICAGVVPYLRRYRILCWTGLALMCVGVLVSMSSGPWLSGALAVAFIAFYRFRKWWKPALLLVFAMCVIVEIISNMHFYDVLSRYMLNPQTAYYRSRLISVGLFEGGMSGHWFCGYGFNVDPGWGPRIDGRSHTDLVNEYISVLSSSGLIGFVPFIMMLVAASKRLIDAFRKSISHEERWLTWCLSASFFAMGIGFMSVSIFGPPVTIFYIMIGMIGVLPFTGRNGGSAMVVRALA